MINSQVHPTAKIHPTAIIENNVFIGANVEIGPYCVIGLPGESLNYEGEPNSVFVLEGAKLTGLVTVDAGTEKPTIIGSECFLMKHSHIGHDVSLGRRNIIACGAKIGGFVSTWDYVNIALNATVHQRLEIPEGVMLGINSCLTKTAELKPYSIYVGAPARYLKPNDRLKQKLGK